ncbi:MAG: hypothetical protein U1E14_18930 [Geminicoccaceae bacterium]
MKLPVLMLSALVCGGACLPLADAEAGLVITTRSGIECVKLGDTTPDILYNGTGAYNDGGNTVNYACPLNGHFLNLNGPFYFDTAYWWAVVDDGSSAANITCYVSTCTEGGVCTSSTTRSSSGVGNAQYLSSVGEPIPFAIANYTNALMLRCSVPAKVGGARSGIRKYTLYAFD